MVAVLTQQNIGSQAMVHDCHSQRLSKRLLGSCRVWVSLMNRTERRLGHCRLHREVLYYCRRAQPVNPHPPKTLHPFANLGLF